MSGSANASSAANEATGAQAAETQFTRALERAGSPPQEATLHVYVLRKKRRCKEK